MRFFFAIPSNPRRQNYRLFELINRNYLQRCAKKSAKEVGEDLVMKKAAVHQAKSRVEKMIRQEIKMILEHGSASDERSAHTPSIGPGDTNFPRGSWSRRNQTAVGSMRTV